MKYKNMLSPVIYKCKSLFPFSPARQNDLIKNKFITYN